MTLWVDLCKLPILTTTNQDNDRTEMRIIGLNLTDSKPIQMAVLSSRGNFIFLQAIQPHESLLVTAKRIHRAVLPIANAMVVFEKMGLWGNAATGMKLVQLAACLFVLLNESGLSIHQVRPQEWQKDILGDLKKGESKADKVQSSKKGERQ